MQNRHVCDNRSGVCLAVCRICIGGELRSSAACSVTIRGLMYVKGHVAIHTLITGSIGAKLPLLSSAVMALTIGR